MATFTVNGNPPLGTFVDIKLTVSALKFNHDGNGLPSLKLAPAMAGLIDASFGVMLCAT